MAKAKKKATPVVTATRTKTGIEITARAGDKKSKPRAEIADVEDAVEAALEALDEVRESGPKKNDRGEV